MTERYDQVVVGVQGVDVDATSDARLLCLTESGLQELRRRYPRIGARLNRNVSEMLANRVAGGIGNGSGPANQRSNIPKRMREENQ